MARSRFHGSKAGFIGGDVVRKIFLIMAGALALSGCLAVTSVDQPSNGFVGQAFVGTVGAEVTATCTDSCVPLFGIRLPADWSIDACDYAGDFSGICARAAQYDSAFEDVYATTLPGYSWRAYVGDVFNFDTVGAQTQITWRIVPDAPGEAVLDYAAGGANSSGNPNVPADPAQAAGFGHAIDITVAGAASVPTTSIPGLLLLSVLLGALALRFGRVASRDSMQILAGSLVLCGFLTTVWMDDGLTAGPQKDRSNLDRANVVRLVEQLRQGPIAPDLSDPKAFVRAHFALTQDLSDGLDRLDPAVLRTAIQVLLDADDLSVVSCRLASRTEFVCTE